MVITLVLLCTLWRTLNTLEIIGSYAMRYRIFRCCCCMKRKAEAVDYSLKDLSFQMKLWREFKLLLRDLLLLLPIMLFTFALLVRSKSLFLRLKRVYSKKREKREI
jgi:hypothetical protein